MIDQLLAPKAMAELAADLTKYYAELKAAENADSAKRPAEVAELDARITRLRDRLKKGDDDMTDDEILSVIERAEAKRAELLAARPEAKRTAKILLALPAAAAQVVKQIKLGLHGDTVERGRARVAIRQLVNDEITLKPSKDKTHLVAHMRFRQLALLGQQLCGTAPTVSLPTHRLHIVPDT
jgi:hypothetical protein